MMRYLSCIVFALSILSASHTFSQTCFDLNPSGVKFFGTTFSSGQCSQVSQDIRYQFSFSSPTPAIGTLQLVFSWGDGSGNTVVGLANNAMSYDIIQNHVFPLNSDCEYLVRASIFVQGTSCPVTQQQLLVQSYRTEQYNQGLVQLINPSTGTNIFDVCPGQSIQTLFNDLTVFNCNENYVMTQGPLAGTTITNPNNLRRWQQIVYNTQTTTGNRIPNVFVDGVQVTNATGLPIQPGPNFYQDPRGVYPMNAPVNATSPAKRSTIGPALGGITAAGGFGAGFPQVGDIFEITLKYWNFCNPYDDPSIPGTPADPINGDNPPITGIALIRIIQNPPQLAAVPANDLCYGTTLTNANTFAVSGTTGSTTSVRWYNGDPLAGGTLIANPQGTNITTFRMSAYPSSAPGGPINTSRTGGAGGVYALWATQVYGGTNGCESQPVQITRIVRPQLTAPPVPSGLTALCNNSPPIPYSQAVPSAGTSIAANTFTNTGVINYTTEYFWDANPSAGVTFSATTGTSVNVTFGLTEPAPPTPTSTNVDIRAARRYTSAPQCTTIPPSARTVAVSYTSVGGAITPTPLTRCDGVATGTFTLSGFRGTVNSWYRVYNSGTPELIGGTVGLTVWTGEVPPYGPGTYEYFAEVQNGTNCSPANSLDAVVTVNPVPPVPTISTSGPTTFCLGGSVTLTSSNTLASSYQWYRNGVAVGGATSQSIILNTVAQSGDYTVQTIGIGPSNCASLSGITTVMINPLPVVSGPTGGGAVCLGLPAPDIIFTISSGTGPYTGLFSGQPGSLSYPFTYPLTSPGVSQTATTITLSNPITTSNGNFILTSLTDASTGCSATALGGSSAITFGGAPPTFTSGPSLTPTSTCFNGVSTTDPQLNFVLDAGSASQSGFILTYRVDGGSNATKTFNTNAGSAPTSVISFNEAALNSTTPSPHVIRIVSIVSPSGCLSTYNIDLNFTVNPLPAAPTAPVNSTFCSLTTPSAISATPAGGSTIDWYAAASGGSVLAGGSGTLSFVPPSAGTYFAESRNTTTGCLSSSRLPVVSTVDNAPSNANAGTNQNICVTTATMAATPANNGGSGLWTKVSGPGSQTITTPSSATTTITGLVQNPPGGAPNVYTFRWTVSSALFPAAGSCSQTTSDVTITVNSLPTSTDPAPQLCETVLGGNQTTGVDLTTFDASVTSHPLGTPTVAWFSDAARTIAVPVPTNVTVVGPTRQFFFRATSPVTTCQNIGVITFTVNSRPGAATQTRQFCEDVIGGAIASGIDLSTQFNAAVTGGAANRSVTWFSDAGLTTLVPTPNSFSFGPAPVTLFARVTNTLTNCTNSAAVNLSIKPKPILNPIDGDPSVCTGNNIILYQLDPTFNPGSTYTWSIVGSPPGAVQLFGGGGTNSANFFALLKFPVTGTVQIDVTETLNGCVGTTSSMTVTVNSAPTPNSITGFSQVCANQTGVNYAVTSPNGTSTYTWTVTGATVASSAGDNINVDFSTISPVTIKVAETAISGCVGADATINVTVSPRPVMTSATTTSVCSGNAPTLNFTSTVPSTFTWTVPPGGVTGAITGTTAGSSGTGNLSQVLTNTSGAVGSVIYNVTPAAVAAPGCQGSPQAVTVTVNPEPVLVTPQTKTICSGEQVNYQILLSPLNLPAGTVFNWPAPVMSDASVQGSSGTNVSAGNPLHIVDVLSNNSASPITATYTISPSTGSCTGIPRTVVVTINPAPRVSTALNATTCSIQNIGLVLATQVGSVAASNYNIVSRSISPGLTPNVGNAIVPASGVAISYLANDNFKNLSTVPLSVTYHVVAVSGAGCSSTVQSIVITINPEPSLSNTLDLSVCSSSPIGLTIATTAASVSAATFNIVGISVAPGLVPGGSNAVIPANGVAANYLAADQYVNTGLSPLTAVYQIVPVSASGCEGDPPKSVTITILPEPVVSATLNNSVCSRSPISLTLNTNGSSVPAASYNLTSISIDAGLVPGGSNVAIANGITASYLTADTYTNTTASSLTVRYTVQGVSAAGCTGANRIVTITINPEPVMAASLDVSTCSDVSSGLVLNTNGTSILAANYNITARSIAGGLIANIGNAPVPATGVADNYLSNDIYTNTGTISRTVTYTVVPVSSAGCVGASKVITLTVGPEPVMSTTLDAQVCSTVAIGLVLNTNGSSVAAADYNIVSRTIAVGLVPNGGNVTVPASGVAANYLAGDIYSNTGTTTLLVTYTVVPVSAAGCLGDPRVITLTVNPEPVIANGLDVIVCSNAVSGITLNTNGASVAASNYNVTARTIAGGLTANGANAVVPATGVAANYLANDRFINTTVTPLVVSYTVVAVSAIGCPSPPKVITATINPEPVMANGLDASICSDVSTNLTLNTSGSSVVAANYNITTRTIALGLTPGGINATVPATGVAASYLANDAFTNTGVSPLNVTYTVVPVSALGCLGASKIITITINPEPVVSTLLNATVCSDSAIGLTLATNGTSVAATSYNIISRAIAPGLTPNGSNAVVPASGVAAAYLNADQFTNTGNTALTVTYTVAPVSTALCVGNPQVITITINPEPVVSTTLNATVCSGLITGLVLNTNGTSAAAASYNITARTIAVGLTAAGANAIVPASAVSTGYLTNDRFTNTTSGPLTVDYTVVPVAAGGCIGNPMIITITVNPEPVLSPSLNRTVCSDLATGLILNTNGSSVAALNYNIVSITVASGLVAAGTNVSIPASGVNANFVANDKFTNIGASALTVVYRVVPISASGCLGAAVDVTVTINPEPVVSTTLDAIVCSGATTALTLNTNGSSVAAANYNITARTIAGGLVADIANAVIPATGIAAGYLSGDKFTNTGATALGVTYTVIPVSADGCLGKPHVITITINPEPVVSTTLNATVCSDIATSLTLATNGTSVSAANYNVTARTIAIGLTPAGTNAVVPANSVATNYLANDRFTNTGTIPLAVTYTVVPVSGVPCVGQSQIITITINPEPVVSNGLDKTVCSDVPVALTLSTLGTSVAAGSYNVTSRVVAGGLTASGSNVAVPATGVAANYVTGDLFTNTGSTPLTVTYTVVPVSSVGCIGDLKVIVVTINPEPVLSSALDQTKCSGMISGLTLTTNGTSVAAQNYNVTSRTIAVGLTPGGSNATVPATGVASNYLASDVFTNTGAASLNVTYTVVPVSSAGCLGDPVVVTLTIDPQPVVSTTLNATICSDLSIGLTLNTNGTSVTATTYDIITRTVAGGLIAAATNAVVPSNGVADNFLASDKFTNTGISNLAVVYTVVPISAAGCRGASQSITMTIAPEPVLATNLDRTVCSDVAGGISLNTVGTSVAVANYNITSVSIQAGLTTVSAVAVPASGIAANYLAGDIYRNLTSLPLEVSYTVVPVSAAGCLGDPLVVKQIVNPEPVLGSLNATVCSDDPINLSLSTIGTSVGASTYNITARTIAGGLVAAGGNAAVPASGVAASYLFNDKFTNTGSTSLVVTYTVVPISATGCLGDPVVVTMTIAPEAVLSPTLNTTVCSGSVSGITLATNGTSIAAANYNVTSIVVAGGLVPNTANATVANGVAASYLSNDRFTNTGASSLTVQYTVRPVAASGCLGDPVVVVLTVNPEPVMDPALATKTVCSRDIINVTLNTNGISVGAANYDITARTIASGLIPAGANAVVPATGVASSYLANDRFTNTGAIPLAVTYTVVPVSGVPCAGQPFVITITINPEPVISPALDNTVCSDAISNIVLGTNGTSTTAATYELVSVTVPGTITASVGNTTVGTIGSINLIRNDKFTNTTNAAAIVVYGVRGISSSGCPGQVQLINLTVDPKPVLDPALNPTPVCSGIASNVTLGVAPGSVGATTYNINTILFPGLTAGPGNAGIGSGKLANAIFNDIYINTTSGPLTAVYSIVPVSAAGCLGAVGTVTLTINPSPELLNGLDRTVCSTDVSGITLGTKGTSIAAANYNIISVTIDPLLTQTAGNTGVRTGVAANEIFNDRFQNLTNIVRTVVYRIEPVSSPGCRGPQVDVTLSVEPTITMIIPPDATTCSDTPNTPSMTNIVLNSNTVPSSGGITFDYTATSTPPGAVTGFFPAQANLPMPTVIADKLVNTTNSVAIVTYSITPKAAGAKGGIGCTAAAPTVVTISVEPKPRLTITPATQVVCEGVPTTMTLSTTTVPGTGIIQFTKIGFAPTGGMTSTNAALTTTYFNGDQIGDIWSNPTLVAQTVAYTFRASIVGGLGCISEDITALLTVNPSPTIAASTQDPICSSDAINIILTPDVANTIATYAPLAPVPSVISGASAGAGNLIFQTLFYNSATPTVANSDGPVTVTYRVTPKANNCDGTFIDIPVVVNPKPKLLSLPNRVTVCHGNTLTLPLASNVTGAIYSWTVDNPNGLPGIVDQSTPIASPAINQVLTNTTGSQAILTYTISAFGPGVTQCAGDQKVIIVTVAPEITAVFNNSPEFICKGSSVFLNIEFSGQPPFSFVYNDGVSDITVNNSPNIKLIQVSPASTTTYTIKSVKDAFNCPLTVSGQSLVVSVDEVDAAFSVVQQPAIDCSPKQFFFKYNQVAGRTYTWSWVDGSPDSTYVATVTNPNQVVFHTFTNFSSSINKQFKVRLEVSLPSPFPDCLKSSTQTVTVYPLLSASVLPDVTDICSGEQIRMSNQSIGVTSHRWFWRNAGSTLENDVRTTPNVTYTLTNLGSLNPQVIEIVYQAKNSANCTMPDVVTPINVYKGVSASFDEGIVPLFNNGSATVTFTNTSTPLDLSIFRYDWVFGIIGDASTPKQTQSNLSPISITYFSPGTKEIILTATNIVAETAGISCVAEARKTITIILPELQASFDIDPKESCFPAKIKVKNIIATGFVNEWRVLNKLTGASFTSSAKPTPPTDTLSFDVPSPGDYTVSLKTSIPSTGQEATAPLQDVKIYDKPLASFDLRPDVVYVPDTEMITFNFSDGANGYDWDFGDGSTSILKEPTYFYKVEGRYDVTLIASFDHGGGVICRDTLSREVTAKLGGQSKIPNAFTPNPNGSSGGVSGNGTFNDVFLPIVRGIADEPDAYNLQIYDRWGNLLFESNNQNIGWDGYDKNGRLVSAGVYVYKLTLRFSDTQRTTQVGDVTLIR